MNRDTPLPSPSPPSHPAPARIPAPPELLAPAGDWDCARAAVENGADAIYFGLERFNARMRAHNFTEADLPPLMEFLHRRGVRGYLGFNILVFPQELSDAERFLRTAIACGVDAAIVQDVGVCRLIRRLSPDFPIHASTQMSVTSAAGVEFARELGCSLVVLAREVPIREVEKIQAARVRPGSAAEGTAAHPPAPFPLEVFVHGALCVAYSGQCLTSEALGGRSANRGVCAQACRMPYDLVADGQTVPLGDRRYLLSPQDLVGIEVLPDLIRAGVASLKIEGRLKAPEYVANITRVYREAIDRVYAELHRDTGPGSNPNTADRLARELLEDSRYPLEMAFSRGLFTGWFRGIDNQALVHGRFGKKRGVFLGEVTRVLPDGGVRLRLQGPLKPGDGVVFDAGRPDLEEEGGRVYQVEPAASGSAGEATLRFGRGDLRPDRIHVGDKLWKTSDPELERRIRRTYAGDQPRHSRPITLEVHGEAGARLEVRATDDGGHVANAASSVPLEPARTQPLTAARLRDQLGRLGGTGFHLADLHNRLAGDVMLPVRDLNRIRRDLVADLAAQRAQPPRWATKADEPPTAGSQSFRPVSGDGDESRAAAPIEPTLAVLIRSFAQLDAALSAGVDQVYCEFENPKHYREAVMRYRTLYPGMRRGRGGPGVFVAPPRIFKMGEDWIVRQVESSEADGLLVRNYDHLRGFTDWRRVGDFSLNIANRLAAEYFLDRYGLEHVTASYDLNHAELTALLRSAPPEWFEITLHQHMPMFHMEHCVFCAFLTSGTDYTNCGRPCDRQELRLRDRAGAEHPVRADAGCRNTVFNALAQTGAEHARKFLQAGARRFRLEFLTETPEVVVRTIDRYRQLLRGELTGRQLWQELKLLNQLGVTRGPLDPESH